ncbi:MAG: hypothetical protein JWM30_2993 [Burkholderia sp.]|jgi:hypothetical protein|nr:hypothetical protein [Burkholderia sp.]
MLPYVCCNFHVEIICIIISCENYLNVFIFLS